MELKTNDFYIGVQGHPELNTTMFHPNCLFLQLIKEAVSYNTKRNTKATN